MNLDRLHPEIAVDVELREPKRLRDSDLRRLRGKLALCGAHVGTRANHVERNLRDLLWREKPVTVGAVLKLVVAGSGNVSREDGNRVEQPLLLREKRRNRRKRLVDDVLRLVDSELVADAGVEARLQNVVRLGLKNEVRARDRDALLGRAELDVFAPDFGGERDPGVLETPIRRRHLRPCGLGGATTAAEDVDFPRSVETGAEDVGVVALRAGRKPRRVLRRRIALVVPHRAARAERRLGHERGIRAEEHPCRCLQALLRHAVGQVARDGARDQVREDIVVEAAPPA